MRSPYRKIYDLTKKEELKRVKTKGHAHNRAVRKMVKTFLLDLYLNWRKAEGLPISEPYSVAIIHGQKAAIPHLKPKRTMRATATLKPIPKVRAT